MTVILPLRFREVFQDEFFFADDAGRGFLGSRDFLDHYGRGELSHEELRALRDFGVAGPSLDDAAISGYLAAYSARLPRPQSLGYLLLVPTLRCNLSCGYCQVSRADISRSEYDWTPERLEKVKAFLDSLAVDTVKIEFQGGEPFLRPDLIKAVIEFCEGRFEEPSFVVCTNLGQVGSNAAVAEIVDRPDVFLSTSLDGPFQIHKKNRTQTREATEAFYQTLEGLIEKYGPEKISALPTIDFLEPPKPRDLIESFTKYGMRSIFLRPVSFYGFARKNFNATRDLVVRWNEYFDRFVAEMIGWNETNEDRFVEEFYLSLALRRLLRAGVDDHVDLRNPAYLGKDYLVIDYDGTIYPTDEARMLSRAGQIDLAIGDVESGLDEVTIEALNRNVLNNFDPDCIHCPYQPACSVDLSDDLARYGRIDVPKTSTFFCQRQLNVFDTAVALLRSTDRAVQRSVARWVDAPWSKKPLLRRIDDPAHA